MPTFLLVGTPRAGTTALHHWLGSHPDACVSRPKETQFFSLHHDRGPEHYSSYFAHHRGEPVVGESTPVYLTLPYVAPRIARLLPDVQLVAVLREPVQQAISSWWKLVSVGAERRPLDVALRVELDAPPQDDDEIERSWRLVHAATEGGPPIERAPYLLSGHYVESIRRFQALIGRPMCILLHEDLVTDPAAAVARIAMTVGLDPARAPSPVPARVNETVGRRQSWARQHTRRLPSARLRRAIGRAAGRLDQQAAPSLDPGLRRELREHFAHVNAGLDSVIRRDVSHWFSTALVTSD